ncbi:MAG: carbon-nitrogen hydrolase family protein [Eubacteriales bacterium]|nr:carbon-nitrogen hydrolase family protein [Eubacteriales bacterium]
MDATFRLAAIHARSLFPSGPSDEAPPRAELELLRQQNIARTADFLRQAGQLGADLAATHECCDAVNLESLTSDRALCLALVETIPGPTSDLLGSIARQYAMNIAANYHERQGDTIYNTSVLIDRLGRITGIYRKVHLPPSEKWVCSAGDAFSVLASDIGRIGFATCYDIVFPEHCRALALNGADIIVHQTMGWGLEEHEIGESLLRVRAADNQACLLVAKNIQSVNAAYGKSCVIDNRGTVLAAAGGEMETVVSAELAPDFDLVVPDGFNALFSGVDSVRARHLLERRPELYGVLTCGQPPLKQNYPDIALKTSPEEVRAIQHKRDQYLDDIRHKRPVKIDYHW